MLPLEAEAVEREVLALCTERSEAMARLLRSQVGLDDALNLVRAPVAGSGAGPAQAAADDRVERLRSEVATLKSRISRLEGEPERPETEATLADLRAQLATAETDLELAVAEEAAAFFGDGQADVPPPGPGGTGDGIAPEAGAEGPVLSGEPEAGGEDTVPLPPPGAAAPETEAALAPPQAGAPDAEPADSWLGQLSSALTGEDAGASAAPPPDAWPAEEALPGPIAEPRGRRTDWRLIHAVRKGDGRWQVLLQGAREIPVRVPGATPDAPAWVHWQPVLDPPVTLSEDDVQADGLALLEVLPEGVLLADPASRDGEPVLVPFVTGESIAAGRAEWDFQTVAGAARGGTLPEGLNVLAVMPEGVLLADPATPRAEPVLVPFAVQENGEGGS